MKRLRAKLRAAKKEREKAKKEAHHARQLELVALRRNPPPPEPPLPERVVGTAQFFAQFVELVHHKYYIVDDDGVPVGHKYMKNLKAGKNKKAAHKMAKFDPTQQFSVAELQRLEAERRELLGPDANEAIDGMPVVKVKAKKPKNALKESLGKVTMEELQAKLAARVAELREQRISPKSDHTLLLLKRAEKKARKRQAKQVKLALRPKKGYVPPSKRGNPFAQMAPQGENGEATGVQFSKFEFGTIAKKENEKKEDKYARMKKLRLEKARLRAIAAEDPAKAAEMVQSQEWKAALERAQGRKVFNDPALLQKTIKRDEKRKAKSKAEWDERLQQVEEGQKHRQNKRNDNIKAHKDKFNQRGKGKGKKQRAGFEGKKRGKPGKPGKGGKPGKKKAGKK